MNPKQISILVLVTALLAAGISATISNSIHKDLNSSDRSQAQIIERLEQLEAKLVKESQARQNFLSQRESFVESNKQLENAGAIEVIDQQLESESLVADFMQESELQETPVANLSQSAADIKKVALVNTGLSEDEAAYILKSESDVTLEQLNARYDNQREAFERSEPQNRPSLAQINPLRAKLGDDYYENYLQANGFPTSARVSSVIESSPGYDAGLQAGDRITSYGGQRVFNLNDVANLTFQGNSGESVLLEIERNGEALQLTIPRGPIGVSSGRNRFRR